MPLTPFYKPFFDGLKEKNAFSISIICLTVVGITLWFALSKKDAQKDEIQAQKDEIRMQCAEVERRTNSFWQRREDSIAREHIKEINLKNLEIKEANRESSTFKDVRIAALEERLRHSERLDKAEKKQAIIFKKERQKSEAISKQLDSISKQF